VGTFHGEKNREKLSDEGVPLRWNEDPIKSIEQFMKMHQFQVNILHLVCMSE
jgi:hypothetical protein